MPLEPESDLHWTAFLYIAGELTPDESSSFERRLAEDQEAREAVAGAVELAGALALVGPEFGPRRRSMVRRVFIGATAFAVAAGLLLATLATFRPIGTARPDASDVATAWTGLRGSGDADWVSLVADSQPGGRAETDLATGDEADVELSTERAVPSWLLSAASAPLDDSPLEED